MNGNTDVTKVSLKFFILKQLTLNHNTLCNTNMGILVCVEYKGLAPNHFPTKSSPAGFSIPLEHTHTTLSFKTLISDLQLRH